MVSALSHALWNYLAKEGRDKDSFMYLLNIFAFILYLPIFYFILPEFRFPFEIAPFLFTSAAAEIIYFTGLGKAYETGDLSVVYPLARSSPIFVTIVAAIVLREKITRWGILGIALIFLGVYMLHLQSFNLHQLTLPFRSLKEKASKFALMAALGTTVYSISDKLGVTQVDPILYAFWLCLIIPSLMTIVFFARRGVKVLREELKDSILRLAVAGFLMKGGYILVLVAMSLAQVSYILALRQVSVVLGAVLGIIFLKEKYGRIRIVSSLIIFFGVYILGVLA
jgi:drug/metabolite transporter (DMT)-like permease